MTDGQMDARIADSNSVLGLKNDYKDDKMVN